MARLERLACRRGDELDELEELHLIDLAGEHLHDRGKLREEAGVRVHQAVAHRGPVIVALVDALGARLFFGVAGGERWIEVCELWLERRPLPAAVAILAHARL